jgi:rod shape determining protein RodA
MLIPAAVTLGLALLVLKQPDLGTALLLLFIAVTMLLLMGLHWRYLVPVVVCGGSLAPLLWTFLKDYQRRRILVFLNPDLDPLGASYHIAQSKIAVGSGGFFGKGWLAATQSQLNFLPLNHTDFIFAVLAEQWGFLGCLLIILAYLYLVTKGFQIAQESTDLFMGLVAAGIAAMLAIQVLINMSMVLGMLPVVGIPLPLLSYGGSSLLVTMFSLGLLLNIRMRRFLY